VIGRFLAAIQFLTVIPVTCETGPLGASGVWFPLVGAMLGASAGAVLLVSRPGLGVSIGALLALVWLLMLTGCLHEDGLADVADAVRAGRSRQKMMEILKDSRIGTYGAVALVVSIVVRWQALARSPVNPIPGLTGALALSRSSLVALAGLTPSVGTGMGQAFAASCSGAVMITTAVESVLVVGAMTFFTGWRAAAAMVVSSAVIVLLARLWFVRRLGGVNGDCLGATCQVVEIVNLLILACQPSI
jgi:adenosylcobinamide-GDP ribazoletransferase